MYKLIKKFLKKNIHIQRLFYFIRDKFRIFYNQKRRSRFFWDLKKGDTRLSFDYPLSSSSIFFDVGGHLGHFSKNILDKYNCKVYIFEPLDDNFEKLEENLKEYSNIKFYKIALSNFDGTTSISDLGASASLYDRSEGRTKNKVIVKSFKTFIDEEEIFEIDFMKINIEGSEFELLDHMIDTGYISKVKHLQIQFHNFVNDSEVKRKTIRDKLKYSHKNIFNFPFIWERWDRIH